MTRKLYLSPVYCIHIIYTLSSPILRIQKLTFWKIPKVDLIQFLDSDSSQWQIPEITALNQDCRQICNKLISHNTHPALQELRNDFSPEPGVVLVFQIHMLVWCVIYTLVSLVFLGMCILELGWTAPCSSEGLNSSGVVPGDNISFYIFASSSESPDAFVQQLIFSYLPPFSHNKSHRHLQF